MYKELAWNNFLKTGDIESYLEYKRLLELDNNNLYVNYVQNKNNMQNVGELLNEINKGKRDSN